MGLRRIRGTITRITPFSFEERNMFYQGHRYEIDPGRGKMFYGSLLSKIQPFKEGDEVEFHLEKKRRIRSTEALFYGLEDGSMKIVQVPEYPYITRFKKL